MSASTRPQTFARRCRRLGWLLLASALSLVNCQSESEGPTGGETHFLRRCDASSQADACGSGLSCLCNVCTLPCAEQASCGDLAASTCIAASTTASCGEFQNQGHCDVTCQLDADCNRVSPLHRCEQGACRAAPASCAPGAQPNQVLFIGDSFFAINHQVTAYLEDAARSAGALSAGERYRDNSSLLSNALALNGTGIADQYAAGVAEAEVKVVIMTGGGADVLLGSCDSVSPDCPLLVDAADAATQLLSRMANDGVAHVLYAFYPDPVDVALREKVDTLRPLIQSACQKSPVPCHFIDLRPTFAGHYPDYLRSDGMNPSAAGSEATAREIWTTMQRYCVAQ